MSGKDITTAAITVADHEKAILYPKKSRKKRPMGPWVPKMNNRKKPATVGGNTKGRVSIPSRNIFTARHLMSATSRATMIPKKNVMNMEHVAVFRDINRGDMSIIKA